MSMRTKAREATTNSRNISLGRHRNHASQRLDVLLEAGLRIVVGFRNLFLNFGNTCSEAIERSYPNLQLLRDLAPAKALCAQTANPVDIHDTFGPSQAFPFGGWSPQSIARESEPPSYTSD